MASRHIASDPMAKSRAVQMSAAVVIAAIVWSTILVLPARAVPSFAVQTGQPCAACHVGAFGPQLKPYARDFKLFGFTGGYTGKGAPNNFPPLAMTFQGSFTNTATAEPGNVPHVGPNDNVVADQWSLYYAGRIAGNVGAFAQVTYDGVGRDFHLDNVDVRWAKDGSLFGDDLVYGVTGNDNPSLSDLWNSTPAWGFPYNGSAIARGPLASAMVDGALGQQVAGAGAYAMWNEWVYADLEAYKGLDRNVRNALGVTPVASSDTVDGLAPYWKLAVTHEFDKGGQNFEFGTYGLRANIVPQGVSGAGTDELDDTAVDANYQWIADPKNVTSSIVSAHATYIHEDLNLGASQALFGTNGHDRLDTWRADVSYSYDATWTPTVQYFNLGGTTDAARWGGSPDSSGVVAELAYVPWGKPDSPLSWANARLAVQYITYDRFDGTTAHASDNNTLYVSLWLAISLNP